MMITDEKLYHRFANGDENALRELMERYGSPLTLYIAEIIHDIHDAEDLMIDAFMRIVTKKPLIWNNCFKAYLYKTARNLAMRFAQKKRIDISFGFESIEKEAESTELVESIVHSKERSTLLCLCMSRLHADYNEVVYLLYFEGLSYKEAAAVMKKSEKQITDLAYRGKKALRKLLEKEGITNAYNE